MSVLTDRSAVLPAMQRPFDPRLFESYVLKKHNIDVAFGVPDSCFGGFLAFLSSTRSPPEHIVMANEGGAVGLAAGYYLATQKVALVYMQNSGLANALNPLQSLAVKEVFGIPMLLMIGWRGKPGEKDEPQHSLIGPRLIDNLRANDIPYEEIPNTIEEAQKSVSRLLTRAIRDSTPVALMVPRGSFSIYHPIKGLVVHPIIAAKHGSSPHLAFNPSSFDLSRESTVRCVLEQLNSTDVTVSSVGGITRELYMICKAQGVPMNHNFFCTGGMGHTFAVAYGISIAYSSGRIFCLEGDGSFLMHVGNNAVLASLPSRNLVHIVICNGCHNSTGSQPLNIRQEHLLALASSLAYKKKIFVNCAEKLAEACVSAEGGTLIVVAVNNAARKSLPRPRESPCELKRSFIKALL